MSLLATVIVALVIGLVLWIGTIALGWLFAQGIMHFANIFTAPVAGWLVRHEYRGVMERANGVTGFSLQDALPELVRTFVLLVVAYLLLRWLYFTPSEQESMEPVSEQSAQA